MVHCVSDDDLGNGVDLESMTSIFMSSSRCVAYCAAKRIPYAVRKVGFFLDLGNCNFGYNDFANQRFHDVNGTIFL